MGSKALKQDNKNPDVGSDGPQRPTCGQMNDSSITCRRLGHKSKRRTFLKKTNVLANFKKRELPPQRFVEGVRRDAIAGQQLGLVYRAGRDQRANRLRVNQRVTHISHARSGNDGVIFCSASSAVATCAALRAPFSGGAKKPGCPGPLCRTSAPGTARAAPERSARRRPRPSLASETLTAGAARRAGCAP